MNDSEAIRWIERWNNEGSTLRKCCLTHKSNEYSKDGPRYWIVSFYVAGYQVGEGMAETLAKAVVNAIPSVERKCSVPDSLWRRIRVWEDLDDGASTIIILKEGTVVTWEAKFLLVDGYGSKTDVISSGSGTNLELLLTTLVEQAEKYMSEL